MTKELRMPDPTGMPFDWTQDDINAVMFRLGQNMATGTFEPSTWEGEPVKVTLKYGGERDIVPKYFGMVYAEWEELKAKQ